MPTKKKLNNDEIALLRSQNGLPSNSHPQSLLEFFRKVFEYVVDTSEMHNLNNGNTERIALGVFSGRYARLDLDNITSIIVDCAHRKLFSRYVLSQIMKHPAYTRGSININLVGIGSTIQVHEALKQIDKIHKLSIKIGLPCVEGLTVKQAMDVVTKALREEPDYRIAWQANIAMSFYDEYRRATSVKKRPNHKDVHALVNQAANNFLDNLIAQF